MNTETRLLTEKDLQDTGLMKFLLSAFQVVTMMDPIGLARTFIQQAKENRAYIILGFEDGKPVAAIVAGLFLPDYEPPSANILLTKNEGSIQTLKKVLDHLSNELYTRGIEIVFARNIHTDREEAFQRLYRPYGDIAPVGTLYKIDLRRKA